MSFEERTPCPACGGAGGGPMGRAGSAWDTEDYVCPRCEGEGMILVGDVLSQRPGIVKAAVAEAHPSSTLKPTKKRAAG